MKDVRSAAVDVLERSERDRIFVDDALDRARGGGLSRRDRGLLTTLVLGATRHRLTLDYVARAIAGVKAIDEPLLPIFRVALYQLLFLARVPAYAAVDAAVRRAPGPSKKFVNAVLRKVGRELEEFASPADDPRRLLPRPQADPLAFRSLIFPEDPVERAAIVHSHPLWLVQRWSARWGLEKTEEILRADNVAPPLTVRARVPREQLIERLRAEGVEARPGAREDSAYLSKAGKISSLAAFREGLFQVQDETQMGVAPRLEGVRSVVDLCAAPGGKAIHAADLGARVVAIDRPLERVKLVAETVRRLGVDVTVLAADGTRPPLARSFGGALVDVPCSNTGVLARRADARWRLKPKDLTAMNATQRALLEAARRLVRPGGRIVYSTCSIEPEENERIAGPGETTLPTFRAGGGFASIITVPG